MKVISSAPAKIILFGEHSVVYGYPAIAVAIDMRVKVVATFEKEPLISVFSESFKKTEKMDLQKFHRISIDELTKRFTFAPIFVAIKNVVSHLNYDLERGLSLKIYSDVPPSAGLGSSAAVNVATTASVYTLLSESKPDLSITSSLSYEAEKVVHGTPSGIDNTISSYGGMIYYEKGKPIKSLPLNINLPLVVGNTKIPRSTRDLVMRVKKLHEKFPELVDSIFSAIGKVATLALKSLQDARLQQLGALMTINHGLLESLGVSNHKLSSFVHTAISNGALGAKLTGAGGGGCMIALVPEEKQRDVAAAIQKLGGDSYITHTTNTGVSITISNE
ncbi:MAG: mevalonate kinase [Candidatus Asgardarchaeia archaeon]